MSLNMSNYPSNIAIICKDYMTVRKCLRGLDWAAEKYYLEHDFKTPIRGINVGKARFTILSSSSLQSHLRGVNWDLIYVDSGIDKDIRDKILYMNQSYMQNLAYLDFSLYDIESVMENIIKSHMVIPKPQDWRKIKKPQEGEYRRITIGED